MITRERIFEPLGMMKTNLDSTTAPDLVRLLVGLTRNLREASEVETHAAAEALDKARAASVGEILGNWDSLVVPDDSALSSAGFEGHIGGSFQDENASRKFEFKQDKVLELPTKPSKTSRSLDNQMPNDDPTDSIRPGPSSKV